MAAEIKSELLDIDLFALKKEELVELLAKRCTTKTSISLLDSNIAEGMPWLLRASDT